MNPESDLLPSSPPHPSCRSIVIIPARNEQETLPATLEALRSQVDLRNRPVNPLSYEILLLLNNCTDQSFAVADHFRRAHPNLRLHIIERTFPRSRAHVGTARRLLMDTAFLRLQSLGLTHTGAILSTDADTTVAPNWIVRNLINLRSGVDVVGGDILLPPGDSATLDPHLRIAWQHEDLHARHTARLEAILDPIACDPWPRHLQHYGASLACTPRIYAAAGGLPAITPLEDVAFIDALRNIDARIRHATDVVVHTSARLHGRVQIGFSGQLLRLQQDSAAGQPHLAESAAWLIHRFASLHQLRRIHAAATRSPGAHAAPDASPTPSSHPRLRIPAPWRARIAQALTHSLTEHRFFGAIDCDALFTETFTGHRYEPITHAIANLADAIRRFTPNHPPQAPAPVHAQQLVSSSAG